MSVNAQANAAAAEQPLDSTPVSASTWLLLVYVWYFITGPEVRFPILGAMHFERLLAAVLLLSLVVGARPTRRFNGATAIFLIFFVWQLVCYAFSPYKEATHADWWIFNYWKLIVFYFFVILSIRSYRDLRVFVIGVGLISLGYQLLSWRDFLSGGSYVYQQGMKRMVGVWSPGGVGEANAFGMLALYTLPFVYCWFQLAHQKRIRLVTLFFMAVCYASIMASGTRAALVCGVVFAVLVLGRRLFNPKFIILMAVAGAIAVASMSEDKRHRYFDLIVPNEDAVSNRGADRVAQESAQSRLQGLLDGWALVLRRPLFGYGPGSSALARGEVDSTIVVTRGDPRALGLHNLYGQVLSETGFLGTILFFSIIVATLSQLRRAQTLRMAEDENTRLVSACGKMLWVLIVVSLVYGMAAHSLYRFYWPLVFALHVSLMDLMRNDPAVAGQSAFPVTKRTGKGPERRRSP